MGPAERRLEESLARIAAGNARLRIFTHLDADGARTAARAADARLAEGTALGPLDGCFVAVKDNVAVAGLPWTAGLAGRRDRIAERDAAVVARLRAAGAVVVGTLNMEEGALGAVTDNPTFGRCLNPLDERLTPGGSSGGSGAAVAAGLVDVALGTDTLGSVRIPAAYCGVAGLKPTRGLVGRSGLAFLSPALDAIGPLARDPRLLADALAVMAGPDPDDPESHVAPLLPPVPVAGLGVGVPAGIATVDTEPAVAEGLARAVDALRALGADVAEVPLEGWSPTALRRAGLLVSEAEGAVELAGEMAEPGAMSDALRALLAYGRAAPSAKIVAAFARLRTDAAAVARAWDAVDVLLLPTAPQRAFAHGTPAPANQAEFTALANVAGVPAVALPVPVGDGLPASVQLMGPPFSDARLLALAATLADALRA